MELTAYPTSLSSEHLFGIGIIAPLMRYVNRQERIIMKKRLLLLLIAFLLLSACSIENPHISDSSGAEESIQESSFVSTSSSLPPAESRVPPETVYEFLLSPYTVSSSRESFGTTYEYTFYLIDDAVAGVKVETVFANEDYAERYYERVKEDCPHASIDGCTVTHYAEGDDEYYFGNSLEKLKFMLDKTGYSYTVNFDEDIYNEENTSIVAE